ncbi:MAG: biotin transporter BioY [Oscillospiraceae bacterium]|nr:biotin transporter BioY [Oscillospiraceae bacterium]
MKHSFSIRDMIYVSLMAVVIALCSWLSVPSVVPFTMQTFAVFCALLLLGGKRGFFAVGLYILLGVFGLPVFSGFRGGLGVLLGPTGGYILGFLLAALLYWLGEKKLHSLLLLILGLLLCYLFGTLWFVYVYSADGKELGFGAALGLCVVPYLIPDAIKLLLAFVLARRVKKAVTL